MPSNLLTMTQSINTNRQNQIEGLEEQNNMQANVLNILCPSDGLLESDTWLKSFLGNKS